MSILAKNIPEHKARKVARALRYAGYRSITIERCRGHAMSIANYLEPMDVQARDKLLRIIAVVADFQPGPLRVEASSDQQVEAILKRGDWSEDDVSNL